MSATPELDTIITALRAVGVQIEHAYEYRGEPGVDRHRVELPDTVNSVSLPFTANEWCAICMSEAPEGADFESLYIGPCCGNTGMVQDIINGAFRSGGVLTADELQTVGSLLRGHDGWEYFSGAFDVLEALQPARWQPFPLRNTYTDGTTLPELLDPWEKLCVIHAALEPVLQLERDAQPRVQPVHPAVEAQHPGTAVMSRLEDGLRQVSWGDMTAPHTESLETADPTTEHGQRQLDDAGTHTLTRRIALMKLLQPARDLEALLEGMIAAEEPVTGFALVTPGTDQVLTSYRGLCVYADQAAAERVLELWARVETLESSRARHGSEVHVPTYIEPSGLAELVAVTVTVADGLVVQR
jgi:hypothetical protein